MSMTETRNFVAHMLAACSIYRPSGTAIDVMHVVASKGRHPPNSIRLYEGALRKILTSRPLDLDTIALVGGLFREAYLATALDVALLLAKEFKNLLSAFCEQEWIDDKTANELDELVHQRLLHWHLGDYWIGDGHHYDDLPLNVVGRPLFATNASTEYLKDHGDELWKELMRAVVPTNPDT